MKKVRNVKRLQTIEIRRKERSCDDTQSSVSQTRYLLRHINKSTLFICRKRYIVRPYIHYILFSL